ncbi:sodium/hydrogen exchanger 9B2 isoform X2 [Protopterus annectens]|uniref:sodium/hydrogen exchanger 9B2 isoform X2 n=1 Tax=Protopterus annectens TaxID=7888 RepID=UPI001CFBD8AF|nr:sodium/hydrogen exchanger 9B2 isoform X2 [Protopterus annectens]
MATTLNLGNKTEMDVSTNVSMGNSAAKSEAKNTADLPHVKVEDNVYDERHIQIPNSDAENCLIQDACIEKAAAMDGSTFVNSAEQSVDSAGPDLERQQKRCHLITCPPQGFLASVVTKVVMILLVWGVVWSITGAECQPGGNLFGILFLLLCAVVGGKLLGLIKIPTLPPLPPLLGMLLAGFLLRNVPVIRDATYIKHQWSSALRNLALVIILVRAGLGLDPKALRKLKAVCVRLSLGPCCVEACAAAVLAHFLLGMPWIWGFILGFVLGAVSPAVVVPSMLILQKEGFGVEKGVPTLLMAAGSFDDVLAITGFNTCLGVAFSSGSTLNNILRGVLEVLIGVAAGAITGFFLRFFPSKDQKSLSMKRAYLILGLSVFAVFTSSYLNFPGSGGLCTLVMAFLAGIGWAGNKGAVEDIVGTLWNIFQPMLFGLIGAEVTVASLSPITVGLGIATLMIALTVRIFFTFLMVHFAGFNMKEKLFISLAWMPKATVQLVKKIEEIQMNRSKRKYRYCRADFNYQFMIDSKNKSDEKFCVQMNEITESLVQIHRNYLVCSEHNTRTTLKKTHVMYK